MTWLLAALAGMAMIAAALWWWLFRMALPTVGGTLKAPGLKAPVEIIRDRWGVPHIYAQSLDDAVFAQGYVHAQDRLWQMELQRRIGAGRLAEIFGEVALEADRFLRRVGLRRAAAGVAAGLDELELRVMQTYCQGVNAAIEAMGSRLPLEFRLLGIKPAPWTVTDSISWAKMMALSLAHNWEDELLRYKLVQRVGPELAARMEMFYPAGHPLNLEPASPGATDVTDEVIRLMEAARPFLLTPGGASNNWVVAGDRTETGQPLLANDPHLTISIPAVWYEAHLVCPETDVTGASLPGSPGIVIGHNQHVGWGITDAFTDSSDLYLEQWHPTEPRYQFRGEWREADVIQEVIRVKGKPDVVETVYVTHHGPVLAGGPLGNGQALSLRWTAHDRDHLNRALLQMNLARSADEFVEATRDWHAPGVNLVYADTQGNIGGRVAGAIPVRREGTGLTPVPGWTGEYEWEGFVPFEEMPQVHNPPSGMVVTANNKVAEGACRHHIGWDYMPGYRAQRITDRLQALPKVSLRDCAAIQTDVYSLAGVEFAGHCRDLRPTDPLERKALDALLEWDGYLTPESVGGAVYEAVQHFALHRVYGPVLGDELLQEWLGKGMHVLSPANARVGRALTALLRDLRAAQNPVAAGAGAELATTLSGGARLQDLLAAALSDAVAHLRGKYGDEIKGWTWGRMHTMKMLHPMGAVKPLNLIFNGPEVPLGGDFSTPLQTSYVPSQPFGAQAWAPSYRVVIDFADLERSEAVLPLGQSGHPRSRHYLDQLPLWHRGLLHPMPFGRQAVKSQAEATLRLEP